MLRAAALLPPTVLLALPAAPAAFDDVRRDARAAVERLACCGAGRIVIVGPGPARGDTNTRAPSVPLTSRLSGALHPTFRAVGIDDGRSGLAGVVLGGSAAAAERTDGAIGAPIGAPVDVADVPAAVALALLAQVGWRGSVEVVAVGGTDAEALRSAGRLLAADDVALLLVGGLSARRGPDAPLAEDRRATAVDTATAEDLERIGRPGDPGAAERLADLDPALAQALAISAWAPWQVLLGALATDGPALNGSARVSVPAGATYAVIGWGRS